MIIRAMSQWHITSEVNHNNGTRGCPVNCHKPPSQDCITILATSAVRWREERCENTASLCFQFLSVLHRATKPRERKGQDQRWRVLLAAISSVMKAVAPVPLASGVQTVSATRVDPFSASLSGTVRGGESSLVTQFLPPCGPHISGSR